MATEDYSSAGASSQMRSRPLERRLRLLQYILTLIPEAADHATIGARRQDRAFWIDCLSALITMEKEQWPFHLLHDAHSDLVEGVLGGLEETVQGHVVEIPEKYKTTMFPRLETLTEEISKANNSSTPRIKLTKPNDPDSFIELLKDLAVVMKDERNKLQPTPNVVQVSSTAKPLLAPLISNLFSTLSTKWSCSNSECTHQAALALFTNRTFSVDNRFPGSFTVLLSKPQTLRPVIRWLETNITVRESLPESTGHIAVPQSKLVPVTDLCALAKKREIARLNVDGDSLFYHGHTGGEMIFAKCEPLNLTKAFLENTTELGFPGKACLAVVLSFSFLDFCSQPWFPGGWKRDNLYLMQNGDSLSLRPFLLTDMLRKKKESSTKREASSEATVAIWKAKLLDHGILLMEIFQQDTFQSPPKHSEDNLNLKDKAMEWFKSLKWDICEHWGQAAEACIKGTIIDIPSKSRRPTAQDPAGSLGSQLSTPVESLDETFARKFYEAVLVPLEADFASQWPNQDPDQVISTLKLPSINKYLGSSTRRQLGRSNAVRLNAGRLSDTKRPHRQTQSQARQPTPYYPLGRFNEGKFFDASDASDPRDIQSALEWSGYFDNIREKLPTSGMLGNQIKIGVLDTGINMNIGWFNQRENRISYWPPGADHHDNNGHGTQVAHLLLYFTKNVDLRICKVTESMLIEDVDISRIADAINHFSEPGHDRVDILNLSFGFPKYEDKLEPINEAIRNAANSGIIVFAAAGNSGGNAGISWPASLRSRGDVIAIYSSDGYGVRSGTNPSSDDKRCIYTLGQGVPSCQTRVVDGEPKKIHRSGSSFATPIAAATAAIVLGFVDGIVSGMKDKDLDHVNDSPYPEDLVALKPRLRTRDGMERVLCETCVRDPKWPNYYLTPWRFFEADEVARIYSIRNALQDVTP